MSDVAHEMRGPLNSIMGFAELLGDEVFGALNSQQAEAVGDILRAVQELEQLISDATEVSRVDAGRVELQPELLAVGPLVRQGMVVVQDMAGKRLVRLRAEMAPVLAIWADERRAGQVLHNLLAHAIRHSRGGSEVWVRAARDDEAMTFTVEYDGPGIPSEDQERLFDDFARLKGPEAADADNGSGLGLALSRRLVQIMGGTISVSSPPGQSTIFTFTLPARDAPSV